MNDPQHDEHTPNIAPPPAQADDESSDMPWHRYLNAHPDEKKEYYWTNRRKRNDFLKGFFGVILVNWGLGSFISVVPMGLDEMQLSTTALTCLYALIALIFIALNVGAVIYYFKRKRRYIAFGMITLYCLVLTLGGACALMLAGA